MRYLAVLLALLASVSAAEVCAPEAGVTLQVLGSGGPIADDGRASTAYLIWVDGEARLMIDAGAGSFLRFGESGATFDALEFVGLSHFHTDHSADFVALLKSGVFSPRQGDLVVAGPSGSSLFPGLNAWLDYLLSFDGSAYQYLSRYLDGGRTVLAPREVPPDRTVTVYETATVNVTARHVPHGIVPAIAFRVEVDGHSLVFASDQNGSDQRFVEFARDADLLLMHLVIPEGAGQAARQLHAEPSVVGRIAKASGAKRLMLSHFMARSLLSLDDTVALVREASGLEPILAEDLLCEVLSVE
ncbi:MAG: MBL fold metallo-hydrolase [Pseudomonadota bacterium]